MARARTGALDALRKLEAEKRTLQSREQELRMEAAQELGQAVLEAGGLMLSPADVTSIIAAHLRSEKRPKVVHDDHPDRVAA
jgi:Family of unknown function (DUF6437)